MGCGACQGVGEIPEQLVHPFDDLEGREHRVAHLRRRIASHARRSAAVRRAGRPRSSHRRCTPGSRAHAARSGWNSRSPRPGWDTGCQQACRVRSRPRWRRQVRRSRGRRTTSSRHAGPSAGPPESLQRHSCLDSDAPLDQVVDSSIPQAASASLVSVAGLGGRGRGEAGRRTGETWSRCRLTYALVLDEHLPGRHVRVLRRLAERYDRRDARVGALEDLGPLGLGARGERLGDQAAQLVELSKS